MMDEDARARATLDAYLAALDNQYDRQRFAAHQRLLRRLGQATNALDLGCGGGMLSVWLARQGVRVWGVELDPDRVAAARLHARREGVEERTTFIQADVCTVDPPERFDLVVAKDIIEHVDEAAFLANLRRLCAPGARALIATQNCWSLQYLFAAPVHWLRRRQSYLGMDPAHLRIYSPVSLARALAAAGMRPVGWHGGYHLPYRLLKSAIPLKALEAMPLHFVEQRLGGVRPFCWLGWDLTALCEPAPSGATRP